MLEVSASLRFKLWMSKVLDRYLSGEHLNYRQVIAIIIPLFFDQLFNGIISMLNTAMISSSGTAAVAAVSMVDSLNVIMLNIFIGIATGGTVIVAQYYGAGKAESVTKAAGNAVAAVIFSAVIISIVLTGFHDSVLTLLFKSAEPDVFANAKIYLIGSALSYPFVSVIDAISGVLRGIGNSKSYFWLSLIKNGSNLLFNIIFLKIFNFGIIGLILSIILSRFLGMCCAFIYIRLLNRQIVLHFRDLLKIDCKMLRRIMFIGIPSAGEQVFFNAGKLITQSFIVTMGTGALAINAICNSLMVLMETGGLGLSLAIVTVVGISLGHGDYKSAKKYVRVFLILGSISVALTCLIMLPLLSPLIGFFSPEPQLLPEIMRICYICSVTTPLFWCLSFVSPAALRAAGDGRFVLVSSLISMWTLRVVLGYVLGIVFKLGILGVWLAMFIEWVLRGLMYNIRLMGKKWLSHKLID